VRTPPRFHCATGFVGTPYYMSPEQAQRTGGGHTDPTSSRVGVRADTKMVTGRRPFDGDSLRDGAGVHPSRCARARHPGPMRACRCRSDRSSTSASRRSRTPLAVRLGSFSTGPREPPRRSAVGPCARATVGGRVGSFTDMSEARDQGYLCEGIAEEILVVGSAREEPARGLAGGGVSVPAG